MEDALLPGLKAEVSARNKRMTPEPLTPREFAVWAHRDQKYGDSPYVLHLEAVAAAVCDLPDPDQLLMPVAYLHDVVEDTPVTVGFVREVFGPGVASAVGFITDPEGPNRKTRKAALHERLALLNPELEDHRAALIVKTADRWSNMFSCEVDGNKSFLNMYRNEHEEFHKAVWRPELCPHLWDKIDGIMSR